MVERGKETDDDDMTTTRSEEEREKRRIYGKAESDCVVRNSATAKATESESVGD